MRNIYDAAGSLLLLLVVGCSSSGKGNAPESGAGGRGGASDGPPATGGMAGSDGAADSSAPTDRRADVPVSDASGAGVSLLPGAVCGGEPRDCPPAPMADAACARAGLCCNYELAPQQLVGCTCFEGRWICANQICGCPGGSDGPSASADRSEPTEVSAAMCPPDITPVDVCGCGCCGQPQGRACWYPGLGQKASDIPDPKPPNCNVVGCSLGVRHLCCADPGPMAGGTYCAHDLATAIDRIEIIKREGASCTFVVIARFNDARSFPISAPAGWSVRGGRRPCDGSAAATPAIGGLGAVMFPSPLVNARLAVHVALFFDGGTGAGSASRLDADDLPLSPGCR